MTPYCLVKLKKMQRALGGTMKDSLRIVRQRMCLKLNLRFFDEESEKLQKNQSFW